MIIKSRPVFVVAGVTTSVGAGSICILALPFVLGNSLAVPIVLGWLPSMVIVGGMLGLIASYLRRFRWLVFFIPPLGWITGLILGSIAVSTGALSNGQQFVAVPFFGILAGLVFWLVADLLASTIHTKHEIG
jgi:hypothetical protein